MIHRTIAGGKRDERGPSEEGDAVAGEQDEGGGWEGGLRSVDDDERDDRGGKTEAAWGAAAREESRISSPINTRGSLGQGRRWLRRMILDDRLTTMPDLLERIDGRTFRAD